MMAKAILKNVGAKYELSTLISIKEDPMGVALRKLVRSMDSEAAPVLKTYSEKRHRTQSQAAALTACAVIWSTTNYILVHNGDCSWAQHLGEALNRMKRRYKLLQVRKNK